MVFEPNLNGIHMRTLLGGDFASQRRGQVLKDHPQFRFMNGDVGDCRWRLIELEYDPREGLVLSQADVFQKGGL